MRYLLAQRGNRLYPNFNNNMPFIRDLVGGIAKANFDPENYRNKNFDPNQPIGGANVPYNKPSWIMRALDSQDAGELMDYNQKLARIAPENTINTAAKLSSDYQRGAGLFANLPPEARAFYGTPGAYTAQAANLPTGTSEEFAARQNAAAAQAEEEKGKQIKSTIENLGGLPTTQANINLGQGQLGLGQTGLANELFPQIAGAARARAGTDLYTAQDVEPYEAATKGVQVRGIYGRLPQTEDALNSQSLFNAAQEGARLQLQPYTLGQAATEAKRGAALAPFGGSVDPMAMSNVYTDPVTGETSVRPNPYNPFIGGGATTAGGKTIIGLGSPTMKPVTYGPTRAGAEGLPAPTRIKSSSKIPEPRKPVAMLPTGVKEVLGNTLTGMGHDLLVNPLTRQFDPRQNYWTRKLAAYLGGTSPE